MNLKYAYQTGIERLRAAKVPEPELDAWYILEYVTGVGRAAYYADPEREMTQDQADEYERCITLRSSRIPLQHITGVQEFMGLTFHVNGDVLIPRQDTETLVETALDILTRGKSAHGTEDRDIRLLDMCTGSGCILLSVLYYAKCRAEGTGSDISAKALKIASENARRLGITAGFIESDLFEKIDGIFSMIMSNPPYIRSTEISSLQDEVRLYDPVEALDGKEDGLYFYRKIINESPNYLEDGGWLLFEIGYDQAEDVTELMEARGFEEISVKKDLAGLDRVVYGRYIK
ncbi:MAG TPA: peptide chain release factor N(5)-glutamine methyltransferase [Candidatus Mediterraneibacter ornithocaccae]|nr:peptide chain release factor N(5)-glutamine methyltransferase [Candidatus Mediterraneibacter ornithocaccae]